jgi:hypothetical protein
MKYSFNIYYMLKKYIEFINENINNSDFKEWFKDSKVVNKDNKPIILYHGGAIFKKFNTDFNSSKDNGIYFTDNYYLALHFAIDNEKYNRDKNNWEYDDVPNDILENDDWEEKHFIYSEVKKVYLNMKNPVILETTEAKSIPNFYKDGIDGVIAKNTFDFGFNSTQYVVFNNNQIWEI